MTKTERLTAELEKNRARQAALKVKEKEILANIKEEERSVIFGLVEKHRLSPSELQQLLDTKGATKAYEETNHA